MSKTRARFWAVVGVLLLAGCAHKPVAKVDNSDQPYRIGREDVLDVAVWRDGDLSRTLPVRPDGYISMPMTGDVLAAGKTPTELAEEIKERLKPYVQEPRVTVIVREVNSTRIFVTGEVTNPGAYPLRGRVSLVQAIALAGGFTDFANANRIVVIRNDGNGGQIPVRYSDLISPDGGQDVVLRPGDTIVVP
ncbi:polysaccharide biosynthesis/export family protein [Hyalangium rubrum]|uniref:Polysaccharide biosynthesis/export family protein n=1 Tax=Hyalangium rubrum TaxID=3103134 RepID=A0ABU5HBA4_9BACT|nr:polysaccharide biosynthesis/export family protein [Hyalangium sp. s54d21]MDY7230747.1 polysaccharide biosynthesis/export family protein [Hyalangium sp. s54d21]